MSYPLISLTCTKEMILQNNQHFRGMKIAGENIKNLRYADDAILIATCEKHQLQRVLEVAKECKAKG